MSVQLFSHNNETYRRLTESLQDKKHACMIQPTGTGKSYLYLKYIEDNPNKKIVLCTSHVAVLEQMSQDALKNNVSLSNVKLLSYAELHGLTKEHIMQKEIDVLILDEFHRAGADKWGESVKRLLEENKELIVIGGTATPIRYLDNQRNMAQELFEDNIVQEMYIGKAIAEGILPTPDYIPVWYDKDNLVANKLAELQGTVNKQTKNIKHELEYLRNQIEHAYGVEKVFAEHINPAGKYIVFCKNIRHARAMIPQMRECLKEIANVNAYISVSDDTKEKDTQVELFRADHASDAIKLMFCVDRLTEGLHADDLDGVIMLRPTTSPIVCLQQMGRALTVNGKKPVIFDLVNNYRNLRPEFIQKSGLNDIFLQDIQELTTEQTELNLFEEVKDFDEVLREIETICYSDTEHFMKWMESYYLYNDFKLDYKREPEPDEEYAGVAIGQWTKTQRIRYRAGALSEEELELLKDAEFVFDIREKLWQDMFLLYKKFKEEYGRAPKQLDVYQNTNLGSWCKVQKRFFKEGKLSVQKQQLLIDAGFELGKSDALTHFTKMVQLYKEFISEQRREPRAFEKYKGERVGAWAALYKRLYKEGVLTDAERESVAPLFGALKAYPFETMLELYKAFKEEKGREPNCMDLYKNLDIGKWCAAKRLQNLEGLLPEEQKEALEKENFPFQKIKYTFDELLRSYEEFKMVYQTEPRTIEVYNGINLGYFVGKQRKLDAEGRLTEEDRKRLVNAGFVFQMNEFEWQDYLNLYSEYVARKGVPPAAKEVYQGVKIGAWMTRQRQEYKIGTLSEQKYKDLQNIGFVFEPQNVLWEEKYNLYVQFKKENKREPIFKESYKGAALGNWLDVQKMRYNKEKMSEYRIKKLCDAGMSYIVEQEKKKGRAEHERT